MPSERIENVKKLEGVVFGVSDEVESEEKVSLDLRISSLEDYFDVPKDQRSEPIEDRLDNMKEALDEKSKKFINWNKVYLAKSIIMIVIY
jgi:hypothetical protein